VSTIETKATLRRQKIKRVVKTAAVGVLLALVCRALPTEYQGPCETVLKICTGGL
jgi:hypothetical protein